MKTLSCGVLIFNDLGEILLCHVTGQKHYDIPKGVNENNEERILTAIREVKEETSIILNNEELEDLGLFKYNSSKDLYLFRKINASIDVSDLKCSSTFEHFKSKKILPEVDGFKFFNKDDAVKVTCKSMSQVLSNIDFPNNNMKRKIEVK